MFSAGQWFTLASSIACHFNKNGLTWCGSDSQDVNSWSSSLFCCCCCCCLREYVRPQQRTCIKINELLYTRNLITTMKIIMCSKTLMCEITKTSMLCSSCCYQLPNCLCKPLVGSWKDTVSHMMAKTKPWPLQPQLEWLRNILHPRKEISDCNWPRPRCSKSQCRHKRLYYRLEAGE